LGFLRFSSCTYRVVHDDDFLRCLGRGLTQNPNTGCLVLNDFTFSSSQVLTNFLSGPAPEMLELDLVGVKGAWKRRENWQDCRVKKLSIDCYKRPEIGTLRGLLKDLHKLPLLSELRIPNDDHSTDICVNRRRRYDITKAVVTLLKRNTLAKLTVGDSAKTNHMSFFEALKVNTSLDDFHIGADALRKCEGGVDVVIDVLQNYNCTAKSALQGHMWTNPTVQYWLMLNRSGRALMRSPTSTSNTSLLESCLCAAISDLEIEEAGNQLSVLFGLLRECPSVWSSNIVGAELVGGGILQRLTGRKRKRSFNGSGSSCCIS
jgi:hypothetical protein